MKYLIQISFFVFCLNGFIFAQKTELEIGSKTAPKQELSVRGGIGLSSLLYSPSEGDVKGRTGWSLGLGYDYNLNKMLALHTGLEYTFYSGKLEIDNILYGYDIPSPYPNINESYTFIVDGFDYTEKQTLHYLNIPVMAKLTLPIGGFGFYAMGGFKFGIPLSAKYKGEFENVTTSAYSAYSNQWHENEPDHGFSDYYNMETDGQFDIKLQTALALEAGLSFQFPHGGKVYAGLFLDYGLNNVLKNSGGYLLQYQNENPTVFESASAIPSYTDKLQTLACGLTLRYSINLAK